MFGGNQKADVTQLRWPGGNFSSNYNWRDGIGSRDQRPAGRRDRAIETEFELEDKQFSGPVEISEVNGPDLKLENNFDNGKDDNSFRQGRRPANCVTAFHRIPIRC